MKLGRADIPKLEEYWCNYNNVKGQLAYRRYELLYQPHDENIGGGKSNLPGRPVEREVVKLHEDNKYRNLSEIVKAIEDVYNKASKEQKLIVKYRYWEEDLTIYEWPDIAHQLTKLRDDDKIISRDAVLRMRNQLMRETAKRIGWISFE
ncbi:transcriptional regulator [Staphylococcus canis]|uniref:Transcriptional regulator n=1 Tax=Staphylococcus canis TaxID=2724942 RepID=A0ABS0T8X6_9STAP|nr:transcriptional regulator [Staphylococcus canis]MBI5975195.1 transcriptional regulator [Staphylococcus canis]